MKLVILYRAVARYLRSLFDNESGRGMKMVPVDNLLAGKTRKEASRMFFETLVCPSFFFNLIYLTNLIHLPKHFFPVTIV